MVSRLPRTPEEWQEAVDLAAGYRVIADLQMYGLIGLGPSINVARCDLILERGERRGVRPSRPVAELAVAIVQRINAQEREP